MSLHLMESLSHLIEYIETEIENNITLDALALQSNISKFHLTRVFKNITHLTLMEYVRDRKLSKSVHDLLFSDQSILEIAMKYQFAYEQSYIRAFKKRFHLTPSRVRKSNCAIPIVEKIDLSHLHRTQEGVLIQPIYVYKPAFTLIGKNALITDEDNYTQNEANKRAQSFFFEQRNTLKGLVNPNIYYGLTTWISNDANYSYYMPALEIGNQKNIDTAFNTIKIPSSKYLMFKYVGKHRAEDITVERVEELYGNIFGVLLPKIGYDFMKEGAYHFEEIDYGISSKHYCEANIYFPIKA